MKHIVILGASYAGIGTAHRILSHANKLGPFKIILVSPNSEFYWNMASPRAIIPGQFTDDQMFEPIAAGFSQYSASQFEFIVASAKELNVEGQSVVVVGADGERTLSYDYLIVATGSRTRTNTPFKATQSTEATKKILSEYQDAVQKAKTIVVAGAGVTGVEIAGELGAQYGTQKEIILLTSHASILPDRPASISKYATEALQTLNVSIRYNTTAIDPDTLPNSNGAPLQLSTGEELMADMYIPAFGLLPNSTFVPPQYLNENGFVAVDTYLNVKGADNVWALGDVCDVEGLQLLTCDRQSVYVAKALVAVLGGKAKTAYKPTTSRMMGLQIGPKAGTGHIGNWRLPSFLVVRLRKTLFVERMAPLVNGKQT